MDGAQGGGGQNNLAAQEAAPTQEGSVVSGSKRAAGCPRGHLCSGRAWFQYNKTPSLYTTVTSRKADPGWISNLIMVLFYINFSVNTPEVLVFLKMPVCFSCCSCSYSVMLYATPVSRFLNFRVVHKSSIYDTAPG